MNHLAITQPGKEVSPAFLQIVSQLEGRLRSTAHRGRLIGVAACTRRAGASYATRALARNLARSGKRVLLADGRSLLAALAGDQPDLLSQCLFTEEPRVWRLARNKRPLPPRAPDEPTLERRLEPLWREMDCLLLDLGAVTASGEIGRFAPELDDLLLVVAAGESKQSQIAYAQRLIAHSGGKLTGCILNKRTYPLPERLFRALYG